MGSGIPAPGSGFTSRGIGISSTVRGSGIQLSDNIRDHKILKCALIGGTKSCYITSQPSQIRADIKSDRILANRREVNSVCASVYNIAIPPPPLPPTLWFSYTNIISRSFNNHCRPTKLVGYVSQRSRLLFPPKKQLVWIMSWTKIEFVHVEMYIT